MFGVGGVQGPGPLAPGPPDQPKDEDRAGDAAGVEVLGGEAGDFGEGEDEDEIEEELDEGDGLAAGRVDAPSRPAAKSSHCVSPFAARSRRTYRCIRERLARCFVECGSAPVSWREDASLKFRRSRKPLRLGLRTACFKR